LYPTDTKQPSARRPGNYLPESSSDALRDYADTADDNSGDSVIETSSNPRAVPRIRAFVESACNELASPSLGQQQTANATKAAEEVVTNIIRHAYHGRAGGTIRVEAEVAAERFIIRIWHHARDFDPKLLDEPRPDGLGQGRFGVYIASQYTDDVQYFNDGQGTHCVSLITNMGEEQ